MINKLIDRKTYYESLDLNTKILINRVMRRIELTSYEKEQFDMLPSWLWCQVMGMKDVFDCIGGVGYDEIYGYVYEVKHGREDDLINALRVLNTQAAKDFEEVALHFLFWCDMNIIPI